MHLVFEKEEEDDREEGTSLGTKHEAEDRKGSRSNKNLSQHQQQQGTVQGPSINEPAKCCTEGATTSTTPIRQLLGTADAQTAHPPTSSTAPAHQRLGPANAEPTPAGAPAAAADRTQRPDATCEGKNG